jgi:ABC-type Fe3+ transport system substrate-binding protein
MGITKAVASCIAKLLMEFILSAEGQIVADGGSPPSPDVADRAKPCKVIDAVGEENIILFRSNIASADNRAAFSLEDHLGRP